MKIEHMPKKWPEVPSQNSQIDFKLLEKRVFDAKRMAIGGEVMTAEMRDLLKTQSKYVLTSSLWQAIEATVLNEAANLALTSATMDHVEFAKALKYWHTILNKMMHTLAK